MSNVQVTKTVRVFSTQGDFNITFAGNTWGELKQQISSNVNNIDGMRAILQSTKQTLELPDAVLPQGDFILFLTPKNVKSGALTEEEIKSLPYNALISACSKLNLSTVGRKAEIQERLLALIKKSGKKENTEARRKVVHASKFHKKSINDKFEILKERVKHCLANTYNEQLLREIDDAQEKMIALEEESNTLTSKICVTAASLNKLKSYVEDIITVEGEVVTNVPTPKSLDLDKASLESELQDLSEQTSVNTVEYNEHDEDAEHDEDESEADPIQEEFNRLLRS